MQNARTTLRSRAPRTHPHRLLLALLLGLAVLLAPATARAAGDTNQPACPLLTEQAAGFRAFLPDCRAYELATPAYTAGQPFTPIALSTDGSRVIGKSIAAFAATGPPTFSGLFTYQLVRTPAGWVTLPLDPPGSDPRFGSQEYLTSSADLTRTLWEATSAPPDQFRSAPLEFYLREEAAPGEPRFTDIGPDTGSVAGASPNLDTLTLEHAGQLYEYQGSGNTEPAPVAIDTNGHPLSECGSQLGAPGHADTYNAISTDGHTLLFTVLHGSCPEPAVNTLYAHSDGHPPIAISQPAHPLPQGSGPGPDECDAACETAEPREGVFQGASQDDTRVFFLTSRPLLNADRDTSTDLYEAQLDEGALTHLTLASEGETHAEDPAQDDPTPGQDANVLGVLRVSSDGSRVYFVAEGVLSGAPDSEGAHAQPGARNLYVSDTLTGRTAFIATLESAAEEQAATTACEALGGAEHAACHRNLEEATRVWRTQDQRDAQTSPDGRFLLFSSIAHLTADDTSGPLVPQLFEYDAQTEQLARVSIGQDGYGDDGNTTLPTNAPHAAVPNYRSGNPSAAGSALDLTENGSLFFQSNDALTLGAIPGEPAIYEYQNGALYLLASSPAAELLSSDATGTDVLFTALEALVPQAPGAQPGLYDARSDGGFPAPASPAEPGPSPLGYAPITDPPPTTTYTTPTNLTPVSPTHHTTPAALTRTQKLTRALKACRAEHKHSRKKRGACERAARAKYGKAHRTRKGKRR